MHKALKEISSKDIILQQSYKKLISLKKELEILEELKKESGADLPLIMAIKTVENSQAFWNIIFTMISSLTTNEVELLIRTTKPLNYLIKQTYNEAN
jgi:hypothetical protein